MAGDEGQSQKGTQLHGCVQGECELDKVGEAEPQPVEPEPLQPEADGEDKVGLDNLGTTEGLVEGGDRFAHVESWSDSGLDGSIDESVHCHHDEGLIDVLIDSDIEHEPHKWQGSVHVEVGSIGEELGGPSTTNMGYDTTSEESDIPHVIEDRGLSDDE